MPSPDSLKIRCFTPIPSVPEVDLDGKMLTKDATTKDCLFTMTEYLSENVLQSIPKEYRIKQFFNKGLFKSFRKQNPFNNTENPDASKKGETKKQEPGKKPAKEGDTKKPVKEGDTKKQEPGKEGDTKKQEPGKEGETKKQEPAKEGDTKKQEPGKEGETKKPEEPVKEDSTIKPDIQVGGKENSSTEEENIADKRELISTYRKIINHNIRLTLNTLFQKNNKIVIKGNTYTIGYYNWTDYDWDIDAKRPTFDKKQYVTSQSVKEQLEKIPTILKHGLVTSNDALNSENDFFSVTSFDNQEEAIKAKEREAAKAKENEAMKAKEQEAMKAKEQEAMKAKEVEAMKAKEEEAMKAKENNVMDLPDDDENNINDIKIRADIKKMGKRNKSDILPGVMTKPSVTTRSQAAALAARTTSPSMNSSQPSQETESMSSDSEVMKPETESMSSDSQVMKPETESMSSDSEVMKPETENQDENPETKQSGGQPDEINSSAQGDSLTDLRRSSDPRYRSSSFDERRFRYDPRYDPRYRSHSKMVNIDESNFAIYISVELYLVKGENLTTEDESNLKCQSNWNNVLEKFDKLTGREKRGILPDYTLEPTSKSSSSTSKEPVPTSKEPVPTTLEPTTKKPEAHGGRIRVKRKTLRQKKRKTIKKKKHHIRKGFRTTRKRKLRGSRRK